jgi:hypothetical protein
LAGEHRAAGQRDHALGHTVEGEAGEAGASVSADHDGVGTKPVGRSARSPRTAPGCARQWPTLATPALRLSAAGLLTNPDQRIAEDVKAFTATTL